LAILNNSCILIGYFKYFLHSDWLNSWPSWMLLAS